MARRDSNTHESVAYDAVQEDGESAGSRMTLFTKTLRILSPPVTHVDSPSGIYRPSRISLVCFWLLLLEIMDVDTQVAIHRLTGGGVRIIRFGVADDWFKCVIVRAVAFECVTAIYREHVARSATSCLNARPAGI